jgi:8-oxo-dGTP pyrophosphatase MutT (NUDIX family)
MIQPVPTAERADDDPVRVRPASTVMVLRDSAAGLQVYMLRRVAEMAFAPGMTVFPGGAVDLADHDPSIRWTGPDEAWWAAHLGVRPADARALVVAAVRELFEETGVLLASAASPGGSAVQLDGAALDEDVRLAILDRRITLASALVSAELVLRADLLRPWANWITPPGRTRRYDTFFFAAALPPGQQTRQLTTEADHGEWHTPQGLLAEQDSGSMRLMPPTRAMLADLAGLASVAQAMAAERVVTQVDISRRTGGVAPLETGETS